MTRRDLKPEAPLRWAVWAGLGLLGLSGLLLAWEAAVDWHLAASRVHGALAMLFLVALGAALPHVRSGLAAKRNTAWGLSLLTALAVVVLSAWGLYYLPEAWHRPVALAHLWCGLALPLLVFIHARKGRR